jgi:hypothetical protein
MQASERMQRGNGSLKNFANPKLTYVLWGPANQPLSTCLQRLQRGAV